MLTTILFGLLLIAITIVIQAFGTSYWFEVLKKYHKKIQQHKNPKTAIRLLVFTGFFMTLLHIAQSSCWAVLYLLLPQVTEFQTFESAFYFSLVTFTTLGYGDITIGTEHRVLSGLEAINGILLIGWSTALMFSVFQNILKEKYKVKAH